MLYILFILENIKYLVFLVINLYLFYIYDAINKERFFFKKINFVKENLTLETALYKIKSKYPFKNYLRWVNTFLKLNKTIIIFIES